MDDAVRTRRRILAAFLPITTALYIACEGANPKGTTSVLHDLGTNARTNEYRIASARNDPEMVSGNDRKAFESCTITDLLVAVGTVGISLAVKRFVGSSPIASTRNVQVRGLAIPIRPDMCAITPAWTPTGF